MTDRTVEVAGLEVAVMERPARRTMELTVDRDGSLFVAVPAGTADDPVRSFVEKKQDWIHRKLIEKADFLPMAPPKELVNGEGFRYLARSYRLLIVEHQNAPVKLIRGRLQLRVLDLEDGAAAIRRWYQATGRPWLVRRAIPWAARLGVESAEIRVVPLGYRWGSLSPAGRMSLHWATLQLRPSLIDYVLVHELAHLRVSGHGRDFWDLVERVMPDSRQRRAALAAEGSEIWVGETL